MIKKSQPYFSFNINMVRIKLIAFSFIIKIQASEEKTTPVARLVSKSHLTPKSELGQETFKMNLEHLLKTKRRSQEAQANQKDSRTH